MAKTTTTPTKSSFQEVTDRLAATLERLNQAQIAVDELNEQLRDAEAILFDAESDYIDADEAYQNLRPTLPNRRPAATLLGVVEPPVKADLPKEQAADEPPESWGDDDIVDPDPVTPDDETSDDFDNWESAEPADTRATAPPAAPVVDEDDDF